MRSRAQFDHFIEQAIAHIFARPSMHGLSAGEIEGKLLSLLEVYDAVQSGNVHASNWLRVWVEHRSTSYSAKNEKLSYLGPSVLRGRSKVPRFVRETACAKVRRVVKDVLRELKQYYSVEFELLPIAARADAGIVEQKITAELTSNEIYWPTVLESRLLTFLCCWEQLIKPDAYQAMEIWHSKLKGNLGIAHKALLKAGYLEQSLDEKITFEGIREDLRRVVQAFNNLEFKPRTVAKRITNAKQPRRFAASLKHGSTA